MNDYMHAMDKGRGEDKLSLPLDYIGISTPPMKDQLESLKTRIFQGLSHVELGFMGQGKGSMAQGSVTPGMYGKEQREAIRELAKLNKVTLSTHATVGVQGMAGRTEQGFSEQAQEQSLNEIKRSIDFAADTAGGGPIVFHAGEFPRPVSQYKEFEGYPGEEERGVLYVANKETGQITPLNKRAPLSAPKYREDGSLARDKETDHVIFETNTIQDLISKKAKEMRDEGKKVDEQKIGVDIYKDWAGKDRELENAERDRYELMASQHREQREEIEEIYNTVKKQTENPDYKKDPHVKAIVDKGIIDILDQLPGRRRGERKSAQEKIEELKNPLEILKSKIDDAVQEEQAYQGIALNYGKRMHQSKQEIDNIATIEEVGLERTQDGIARAGIYAMKKGEAQKLDQKLFVAPENIWPDTGYGAHPKELKEIIERSRNRMAERLTTEKFKTETTDSEGNKKDVFHRNPDFQEGLSRKKADEMAKDHIKATFDIGHANIWRKYFQGSDKDFTKWMNKQVEDLNKKEIIGHVHISDNVGFEDEHLTPGQGNAPIGEFTEKMRESGFEGKMIIEPAHQDVEAWTGGLKFFRSPVYRTQTWTDIDGSYLTEGSGSPTYMVGGYATDVSLPEESRDQRFWTRLPIE